MRKHLLFVALLLAGGSLTASPAAAVLFFDPVPVDSTSGSILGTASAVAADPTSDIVHVIYHDETHGRLLYALRAGGVWSHEIVDTGGVGQYLSIALDGAGTPHVAYYDSTHQTLKYAVRSAGWVPVTVTPPEGGVDLGSYCSVAVDGAGMPSIGCHEAVSGMYRYYRFDGSGWAGEDVALGIGSSTALQLDSAGDAHLAILSPDGRVLYCRSKYNGEWIPEEANFVPADSAPSLALDRYGRPRLSWGVVEGAEVVYAERHPAPVGWIQEVVYSLGSVDQLQTILVLGTDDAPRLASVSGTLELGIRDLIFARRQCDGSWASAYGDSGIARVTVDFGFALDYKGDPVVSTSNGALLATEAVDPRILSVDPGTARVGPVSFAVYGYNLNYGGAPLVSLGNARTGFFQTRPLNVSPLGLPQMGVANFDLTEAPPGPLDLTLMNGAANELYPGAMIVYTDGVNLQRLTSTPAVSERWPAFPRRSAGFDSLAFVSKWDGYLDVYIRCLFPPLPWQLNDARPFVQDGRTVHPGWSATGDSLVVADAYGAGLAFVDRVSPGGQRTEITLAPDFAPEWSPVDDRIVFARALAESTIFTVRADGSYLTQLTIPSNDVHDHEPTWSPDGERVVFQRSWPGLSGLYAIPSDSGEVKSIDVILPPGPSINTSPAWSPDGNWIAFASNRAGNFDIWVVDARGAAYGLLQITDDPADDLQPTWMLDCVGIAFVSTRSENEDIYLALPLPMAIDSDGDGLIDAVDACPSLAPQPGQMDRDYDGCPDPGSSFRQVRYWTDDQLPVAYRTDAAGDPRIGDGSEWAELQAGFDAWASVPTIVLAGGDDGLHDGPSNAVSGDGLNSITFSDLDGYWPGVLAMAPTATVLADTMIGGRLYRPGQIVDADILFNASQFSFSTPTFPGPSGSYDLRSLATHEFGHFFGMSHSSLQSSTMFYVVYRGAEAQSIEEDDLSLLRRGYAEPGPSLTLSGRVLRGDGVTPIPGAALYAISAATGDTLQMTLSGLHGFYRFFEVSEDFRVWVQPLDGSAGVNGLTASGMNTLLDSLAEIDFLPEYADSSSETNQDFVSSGFIFPVALAPLGGGDIIANLDLTGPAVVSTNPAGGALGVPAVSVLSILFDESILLASVPGNLTLENLSTGMFSGGAASTLQSGRLLVFTPSAPLSYEATYRLVVGPGITDFFGNSMADSHTVDFVVETAPPLAITAISPIEVPVGGLLVLSGTGFDATEANNSITFTGGVSVNPISAGLTQLFVEVPAGAQSGEMTVTVNSTASNAVMVTIVPPMTPPQGNFLDEAELGADPRKLAINPAGTWVYVATDQGVSAVDAFPSSGGFLNTTPIVVSGGCSAVATLAGGLHAVAVGAVPPKLYLIDTSPSSGSFHSVVAEADLTSVPLGVTVLPGGEALVVYADRVTLHSSAIASLGQELREWSSETLTFLGDISVSAGAGEAYATAGGGKIAVLGLGPGEGVAAELLGGIAPGEIAGLPTGDGFLGVDETAVVRRFGVRGPLQATLISDGGYRGVTVSPEGSFALAANFTANRIDILSLAGASVAWSDSFSTGVDPRDVVTGSAGRYIYVITGQNDRLEVYDTLSGPRLTSVWPSSGTAGTLITLAGSGFDPVAANNVVECGNAQAVVHSVNPDATGIVVSFGSDLVSGSIVVRRGPLASNSIPFLVTSRATPGNFAATGTIPPYMRVADMIESPSGRLLIAVQVDGSFVVRRADRSQPDFLREVQFLSAAQSGLGAGGPMAITPDGRKLYVLDVGNSAVAVFSVDEQEAVPLARVGSVVDAGGPFVLYGTPSGIEVTGDGKRLFFAHGDTYLVEADAERDSVLAATWVVGAHMNPDMPLAIHPLGNVAYVGIWDWPTCIVKVVDIDPLSPTYRSTSEIWLNTEGDPLDLKVSPDGSRLFCLVGVPALVEVDVDYRVFVAGADSTGPNFQLVYDDFTVAFDEQPHLLLNHSGSELFVLEGLRDRVLAFDAATFESDGFTGPLPGFVGVEGELHRFEASQDDGRIYVQTDSFLVVVDVAGAAGVEAVSGTDQTGVTGQALPVPFKFRFTAPTQADAGGAFATFRVRNGDGTFLGGSDGSAYTAAGPDGNFQAAYIAGTSAGQDTIDVSSALGVFSFVVDVASDPATVPPTIVSSVPGAGATLGVNTAIAVDFSEPIDPASVTSASFVLRQQGVGSPLAGTYSYADGNTRAVFQPAVALSYATGYEYEVTAGVTDADGNPLANPGTVPFMTSSAPPLALSAIQAPAARVGYPVVLSGTGFGTTPDESKVLFGSVETTPLFGDPGALHVLVPLGAESGSVRVAVGADTSNAVPFTVLPPPSLPVNELLGTATVPASGQQIVVVPDGSRAYMTAPGANAVVPILIATQQSEAAIAVGIHPFGVTNSPSGDRIYVTNFFTNDVSVVDADPAHIATFGKVIKSIPTGLNPAGLAANPDGRSLYVANYGAGTLSILDTDSTSASAYSAKAEITTSSGSQSVVVTPDGGRIVVGTDTGILVIDADDTSARQTITTNSGTQSVSVTPDGGLAVVLTTDDRLILIDILPGSPFEGMARAEIVTGSGSQSVAVSPDGAFVYVTTSDGTVKVYQIVLVDGVGAVAETLGSAYALVFVQGVDAGENTTGMAFDPTGSGLLLVIDSGSKTVSFINTSATATLGLGDMPGERPARFAVLPASPNPFFSATRITFDLPAPAEVWVTVYAADGSRVRALLRGREFPPGRNEATWDGADDRGRPVGAGVYFVKVTAGTETAVRRLVRLH